MNTANVAGILSSTTSVSGSVPDTSSVSGTLDTSTSVDVSVLTKKGGALTDMEDYSETGKANTMVIRYNKADDTYKVDNRNLDGGTY